MASQRIALVSIADAARATLADYLRKSGFDVHVCEELAIGGSFPVLVLLDHETHEDLTARVRAWMKGPKAHVIIVVTSRPSELDELRAVHPERLVVFAPPVFGWDVVDALRGAGPRRPRSA